MRKFLLPLIFFSLQTFAVENGDFTVKSGATDIWIRVAGKGPVCILPSPAWGASVDMYMSSMKELEKTHTIVYMDSRGCGRSGRPESYSLAENVGDIENVRKFLGADSVCLIGHSMAGVQAVNYASKFPKRVSKMYLIGTSYSISMSEHKTEFVKQMAPRQGEPWFKDFVNVPPFPPETDAQFKRNMMVMLPAYFFTMEGAEAAKKHLADETFSASTQKIFNNVSNKPRDFDIRPLLAKIHTPTVVISGQTDPWGSEAEGRVIHELLKGSRFVVFKKSRHFPWMEEPEKFAELFSSDCSSELNNSGI